MLGETISKINGPSAWRAGDLGDGRGFTHRFTADMVAEIDAATRAARAKGLSFTELTQGNFPIPKTAELLKEAYDNIENGCGFTILSGWPCDNYSYDENVIAYCGVGAYIGGIVYQNYERDQIVDVKNEGVAYSHESRGYRSDKLLPFHTDGADITGLLCLGQAARGGESLVVSAAAVFNTILEERPEYMETLCRGFFHHRRRQHDPGENPVSDARIPVFAFHNGHLHCCYNRNPIDWVEKEGIKLTGREIEVLDYFDSVVARPAVHLRLRLEKGDMQIFNNFVVLHSRTSFEDDEANRRHLVRLWLEDPASKRMGETLLDIYVPGTSRYAAEAR